MTVTQEDIEGLIRTLNINIYLIENGAVIAAVQNLKKLKMNLENNKHKLEDK